MKLLKLEADYCQPCKQFNAVMESVDLRGLTVEYIDVGVTPDVAVKYRARSVPQLLLVDDSGALISRVVGLVSGDALQTWLDSNVTTS